jgi:hypothetical protein
MPIPLLAALVIGITIPLAWIHRKDIVAYFNSADGKRLLEKLGEAAIGAMEPYQRLVDEAYPMPSYKRREFFRQAKARMGRTEWAGFVGYCQALTKAEPRYMATWVDLTHSNQENQMKIT